MSAACQQLYAIHSQAAIELRLLLLAYNCLLNTCHQLQCDRGLLDLGTQAPTAAGRGQHAAGGAAGRSDPEHGPRAGGHCAGEPVCRICPSSRFHATALTAARPDTTCCLPGCRTEVTASSAAGVEFAKADQRYLLVLSTALSTRKAGAPERECSVKLRADVTSTKPIEPDEFQGFATTPGCTPNSYNPSPEHGMPPTFRGDRGCPLSWLGNSMGSKIVGGALKLSGGSAQLLTYTLAADWRWPRPPGGAVEDPAEARRAMVGRLPPRKV